MIIVSGCSSLKLQSNLNLSNEMYLFICVRKVKLTIFFLFPLVMLVGCFKSILVSVLACRTCTSSKNI